MSICLHNCSWPNGNCIDNVCVCEEAWSGKSDILSRDGFDCNNPVAGERIIWSIYIVAALILLKKALRGLMDQIPGYQQKKNRNKAKGKPVYWYTHSPFLIIFCSFLTVPLMLVIGFQKTLQSNSRQFGVSWLVSFCFLGVAGVGFTTNLISELNQFDLISAGSGISKIDRENIRNKIKVAGTVALLFCK